VKATNLTELEYSDVVSKAVTGKWRFSPLPPSPTRRKRSDFRLFSAHWV